ncbi:hypothetical protein ILYODFUR_025110 [Ilyodon furcidens]|uniref:Uncharacterized protein n=1 Tax=Ilyodon furcidens TaxID=33524 RepID=A0ABV0TLS4_9TELE
MRLDRSRCVAPTVPCLSSVDRKYVGSNSCSSGWNVIQRMESCCFKSRSLNVLVVPLDKKRIQLETVTKLGGNASEVWTSSWKLANLYPKMDKCSIAGDPNKHLLQQNLKG